MAVINPSLHIGFLAADLTHKHGWAHYSLSMIRALSQRGVQLTVITPMNSPAPSFPNLEIIPLLPNIEPMQRHFLARQFRALPSIRRALSACNLIHSAVEPYAPIAALAAGGRPLIITGHGSYVRASQMRKPPVNQIYARALKNSLLVCVSHYTAKQAQIALPGIQTTVIPNGIDPERFAALPPLPKDGHTILSVGAVKRRKGILELVRAVARIRERIANVRCVIVGSLTMEPDYVSELQAEIATLNLKDAVQLTGRVSDDELKSWYARADIFALPSQNIGWKFEGFGLSLLEASAAGLPVIGSRDCGAEDAIEDGVTGFLVSQQNAEAGLADALLKLLGNPELRASMGAAGRERAFRMTWNATAEQLVEVYRQRL